ncbi:MAG: sporulation protein [Betaproteobacteria bacterium HGW-Betaproteobacteria-9]|jgi:DedD protein|nr:MAG: sporulation protein [Betaproteobacteria bacterium HGW-Betaproteobacteria-9]
MLTPRSGSQSSPTTPPPQSIEAIRRRARHRLIGAAVLVLLGVLGFPMLFDTQPRPVAVDIPIEIPARHPAQPLPGAKATSPQAKTPVQTPATVSTEAEKSKNPEGSLPAGDGLDAREEVVAATPESDKSKAKDAPVAVAQTAPKPVAKVEVPAKESAAATETARAKALLEDKPAAGSVRIVVQVGAFAEADRARETRLKLERAGLTTYTHVAETPQGKRIRVRLGPFTSRAEADKAAARVKALGLPAAILTL